MMKDLILRLSECGIRMEVKPIGNNKVYLELGRDKALYGGEFNTDVLNDEDKVENLVSKFVTKINIHVAHDNMDVYLKKLETFAKSKNFSHIHGSALLKIFDPRDLPSAKLVWFASPYCPTGIVNR